MKMMLLLALFCFAFAVVVEAQAKNPPTVAEAEQFMNQAEAKLAGCPDGAVLVVHSPPKGHVDRSSGGRSLGSEAILRTIEQKRPRVAICGHIHEAAGEESSIGPTRVLNAGPEGTFLEID